MRRRVCRRVYLVGFKREGGMPESVFGRLVLAGFCRFWVGFGRFGLVLVGFGKEGMARVWFWVGFGRFRPEGRTTRAPNAKNRSKGTAIRADVEYFRPGGKGIRAFTAKR